MKMREHCREQKKEIPILKQVAQITAERDNAVNKAMVAEQKIKDMATQLGEKPDGLSLLENELKELTWIIHESSLP